MKNKRDLYEPMTNDLNISKLVLNQFLRDVLRTVRKVQSLDLNGMNQMIEGFTLNLRNPDSGTLGKPRPGQV